MGCYNETCAITGLPIVKGAPVVVLKQYSGPAYKAEDASKLGWGVNDRN